MYKEFDDFLAQRYGQCGLPQVDFEKRKQEWLDALKDLYENIQSILHEYIQSKRVVFLPYSSYIEETLLGRYEVPAAVIVLQDDGVSQVRLEPQGTYLIGKARGAVDMVGPAEKRVKLLLVDKNDHGGRTFNFIRPHRDTADNASSIEWVWKIAAPPPHFSYLELNEPNFFDAFMFVMG